MRLPVSIHGGALAGCAAAIAACRAESPRVRVFEKSRFPRHKVCGEFLSSGVEQVFQRLGLWSPFQRLGPAAMTELALHFPGKSFRFPLPETCWGVSRFALDRWLMERAIEAGVEWVMQPAPAEHEGVTVVAHGRKESAPKGNRVFGFKAHHRGPATNAIELYFFEGGYVGVNPVEGGLINVCGLGPEPVLRRHGFDYDALSATHPALRERLSGFAREMPWMTVGPLVYGNRFDAETGGSVYPAGDALVFVDPFTGTGMFNALLSGMLAGEAATQGQPTPQYLRDCRRLLRRPFVVSSLFRAVLRSGLGGHLAGLVPGPLLFRLTRAHLG